MTRIEMSKKYGADLLFLSEDYYDAAILGVTNDMSNGSQRIVYDMGEMINITCKQNQWTVEEAIEFLEYNTWSAYVGNNTPVFVQRKL